jgi:hypothetical protein
MTAASVLIPNSRYTIICGVKNGGISFSSELHKIQKRLKELKRFPCL